MKNELVYLYLKHSSEYTDKIQSYGCDEAWLQIDESRAIKGDAWKIATEISNRVKEEVGITVSIGISWNKIFAKLGSDYKKPDAITEISRENYKDIAWKLPASDLLYVGRQTAPKLRKFGLHTIGDIAKADPTFLEAQLGKMGWILYALAN